MRGLNALFEPGNARFKQKGGRLKVSTLDIRKLLTLVETTKSEMGRLVDPPTRKAAALAVITNPFAGRDSEDLFDIDRYR